MNTFIDQTGHAIRFKETPRRIISLVPSQSEFLWDLGLGNELIGITKFCVHPKEMFNSKQRVGGTKSLDIEKIRLLKPDLIIGNKEENEKEQIEILRKEFQVWLSDVYTLEDAYEMMISLGGICDKSEEANKMVSKIKANFTKANFSFFKNKKAAYLMWYNPYMAAAKNTFINSMVEKSGFVNVFNNYVRYPEITPEQLKNVRPDFVFLSTEPFPFKKQHIEDLSAFMPDVKIILVDGEMFSWYGSRLQYAPAYIESIALNFYG